MELNYIESEIGKKKLKTFRRIELMYLITAILISIIYLILCLDAKLGGIIFFSIVYIIVASIIKLIKRKFTPDFSVLPYDIVIGNNACPVAGPLLKINKKPTLFTICDRPETDGKLDIGVDIKSKQEFINELEKRNGCVKQIGQLTIVDNSRVLEVNDLSCDQRENH